LRTTPPLNSSVVALCVSGLLLAGCLQVRPWRVHERPWTEAVVASAHQVRATRADGTQIVLEDAQLDAAASVLSGRPVPPGDGEQVSIAVDTLTQLETSRVESSRVLANIGLGALYCMIAIVVLFALNPPVGVYG